MDGRRRMRGATRAIDQQARALRASMTEAEKILWRALRDHQQDRLHFRRQHPIDRFIVDFYCFEKKLCVEVDGAVHDDPDQAARDAERTAWLEAAGFRVLRFRNEDVTSALHLVVRKIRETAREIG